MASGGKLTTACVKIIILKSTKLLAENLRLDNILLTLQSELAITSNDATIIKNEVTPNNQVQKLLKILENLEVSSYEVFMSALKEERQDLYEQVKKIEKDVVKAKEDKGAASKNEPPSVSPQPSPNITNTNTESEFDVMISYQWDAQDRMLLLKRKLIENGRSVWMDVDQIVGNLNDRMAEGVAKSKAIIICCSQKYHDSGNCKKEAELASRRKKKLIPLKYTGYDETGWLDLIVGGLLYYDVSTDEALNNNFDSINRAVERAINQSQQ